MDSLMSKVFKKLQLHQVDKSLETWRITELSLRPNQGWVRSIRTSLGMTMKVLGQRLDITIPSVSKIEKAEASGTITLNSLRRAAEALDCELKYALVPRSPLRDMRKQQAIKKAQEHINTVAHSMTLEGQEVDQSFHELIFEELVKDFLEGSDKLLWDETPKVIVKNSNL